MVYYARMTQSTNKRKWEYDTNVIAAATGQSVEVVRDHKQGGKFNPDDFVSVCRYVVGKILEREAKLIKETP